MPSNKRISRREEFAVGGIELVHLMEGCCLIGGGCGLCDHIDAMTWVLRIDFARQVWEQQREALLAAWWGRCDERGEPGASSVPTFAEILFDGAVMPRLDPAWPAILQRRHFTISTSLAMLEPYR
jgi:hypothetical protein